MSAIWGAIDLSGRKIPEEVQKKMRRAFDRCVIDRFEELIDKNVYLGCGIQYFVPEAVHETLPYARDHVFYTADVVLDNREELCQKIGISWQEGRQMPDGELLYRVYRQLGRDCLNDLLGAYAFVWYDRERNRVDLVLDAVGNRCLYYRTIGSVLYFSSLLAPLAELTQETELNDRWITDFLAMDHLFMVNETCETPVKDVRRIAPAQVLRVGDGKIQEMLYWTPFSQRDADGVLRFASDQEYADSFRNLWDRAVKEVMRTDTKVSILLSGGLDSTAVAAVAAPCLKEQGKKLYSYTAVPMKGYQASGETYYVDDESEDVKKTAEFYGNIETCFVDLEGKHPWELAAEELRRLEMPYKSIQNSLWLAESMRKAYENGSRLMLSGEYGNTTISYTDLYVYTNSLYRQRKLFRLKREIDAFSKSMGFSAKYAWKQIYRTARQPYEPSPNPYRNSFVKRELAEKCGSRMRLDQLARREWRDSRDYDRRSSEAYFLPLRQIGEIVTKHSLMTGILLRDPTKDKRVIEFCMRLPMEQFCKEGMDRRLVKVYLRELLPEHVIHFNKKGRQSADLRYRLSLDWTNVRKEWLALYEKYESSKYVDTAAAVKQLTEQPDIEAYTNFDLTRHMYTLLVLQYESIL